MAKLLRTQLLWILLLALFLGGCCNPNNQQTLIRKDYTCQDYYKMLQKKGVQIINVGETYQIVIPSDDIFNPNSANFSPEAMEIMGPLAGYLRCTAPCFDPSANKASTNNFPPSNTSSCFETTYMKITGHTDNSGSLSRSMALSERQAQRVEKFLSESGLDARIMLAIGRGPYVPIADNSIPSHRAQNRRIDIRFRKVVVPPLV